MSRVAKAPVVVPAGVTITLSGQDITVKGPVGELSRTIHSDVVVSQEENSIITNIVADVKGAWAQAGTTRALINNMVEGVSKGFEKKLILQGVGYRAKAAGKSLDLSLGFSHHETLSLSHDLGHTPFGHAGEEVLNHCMKKYGGFNHNIQTLRIVTLLENKYYKFFGLNLTIETLDGLIKHNGPVKNLNLYNAILKKNLFKNKIVFHAFPSLEAQVAAISDDIAYNNHDLEDGLRAGLFTIEKFNSIPFVSKLINKHVNNTKNYRREIIINQIVRELINVMVVDVINTTNRNLKKYNPQSIKDIYKQDHLIVDFSDKIKKVDMQIKDFLRHNMYNHKKVIINTNKGKRIIKVLFNYLSKNPKKYINEELVKKAPKERVVADFIAGMTDRYAINLHKKNKMNLFSNYQKRFLHYLKKLGKEKNNCSSKSFKKFDSGVAT